MKKVNNIVFVDDDMIIGLVSKRLLEQLQIAESIHIYDDGFKALSFLQELYKPEALNNKHNSQDLLFLDIDMPGLGAFGILEKLRELEQRKQIDLEHVMITVISAQVGEKEIEACKAHGVVSWMEKPLRPMEIERLVASLGEETFRSR